MPSETAREPRESIEEAVRFPSEGLALEGRLVYPSESAPRGAVLLCPPHPFLGGDMNGNVLRALRAELSSRGFAVLAFNYRGIGASETDTDLAAHQKQFWEKSTCPGYEAKIFVDTEAAFRCLTEAAGGAPLHAVGYSFGCLAALDLAARHGRRVAKVGLVSPPVAKWELKPEYLGVPQDKAVCFSPGDFACPEDRLTAAYEKLAPPKALFRFMDASHFYVGREKALAGTVAEFLERV